MKQRILKKKNCSVIREVRSNAIFHDAETARRVAKQLNQIGIEPAGIGF
jgi:hypothetical protein